jgi:hypothetical protein
MPSVKEVSSLSFIVSCRKLHKDDVVFEFLQLVERHCLGLFGANNEEVVGIAIESCFGCVAQ